MTSSEEEAGHPGAPDVAAEWWTVTDVAAYLGIGPDTVSSYKSRGQMPKPDSQFGRTPVWRPITITEWAPRRRRDARSGDTSE